MFKFNMFSDFIWQIGGSIINRASVFISLLLLSGVMIESEYGQFGLMYNICLSIASVLSVGLGIPARRHLAIDESKNMSLMKTNIIAIFILVLCLSIGIGTYFFFSPSFSEEVLFYICIFFLSVSCSLTYYLNYHYSGLNLFKEYNKTLLPINILLPILFLTLNINNKYLAIVMLGVVLMIGNIAHIYKLVSYDVNNKSSVSCTHLFKESLPCFFQAIFNLPVFVLLQTIVVSKWNDASLVGIILLTTQILNLSNLVNSKMLTVFSPKLSNSYYNESKSLVPTVARMFFIYIIVVISINFLLYVCFPHLLSLFDSNLLTHIDGMRYFLILNALASLLWFFTEYLHSIGKSWICFVLNFSTSILIFVTFYIFYATSESFDVIDYSNCIFIPRIAIFVPLLCLLKMKRKF